MPIYEYRCESCGHTLDALQKINDTLLRDCPQCNARDLRRLVSAPSFRLKGSGWYETDFKSDKEKKRNLAGHSEPSKDEKTKQDKKVSTEKSTDKKSSDAGKTSNSKPAVNDKAGMTK